MSFRTELKIPVSSYQASCMLSDLNRIGFKSLYRDRVISSVYFDTRELSCFRDSEEGVLPRKKVRIRTYPNESGDHYLEKKISSIEGRYKTSEKIESQDKCSSLLSGIFDQVYGHLNPVISVEYVRSYLLYQGIRVTYDRQISYSSINTKKTHSDRYSVIEIKADALSNFDYLHDIVPFSVRRFSKFSNGMSFFYYDIV